MHPFLMVNSLGVSSRKQPGKMVSLKLPAKPGAQLVLYHGASQLALFKSLQQQGIVGKTATLSCTFVPADLFAAWFYVHTQPPGNANEFALEGGDMLGRGGGGAVFEEPPQVPREFDLCI